MEDQQKLDIQVEKKLDTIEKYEFEPIKGYPMLHWKGKRPFTSTQFYPAQLKESYGEEVEGWMNKIFWGDNLQVMSHMLKEFRGKIDLIYIDPPYDSKADYKKKINLRGRSVQNDNNSFEEKQYTDIWTNDEYLQFMYERLIMLKELLSDTGSIYLHVDYRKSHHLRSIMDEIFGDGGADLKGPGFKNEIAYGYRIQGVGKSSWARKHDTILFYSKTSNHKFKPLQQRIYYRKKFMDVQVDENGRFYSDVFVRDIWMNDETSPKVEILLDEEGNYYSEFNSPDIWDHDETKPFISGSKEYLQYPTQKSKGLLKRIINQMTEPGDIVFDCFMGSGTTQAVALELGRKFIGADINLGAVETTIKRLISINEGINDGLYRINKIDTTGNSVEINTFYKGFSVLNVNNYDVFRNPVEAKEILKLALEIQPLPNNSIYDGEKDGRMVKIMPVNRIATRADLNDLISGFNIKAFEKKFETSPNKPVESLLLVCMGHEPDLAAALQKEMHPYKLDVEVVDILRDKSNLEFKRDSEANVSVEKNKLIIKEFYPMNLLQKLSIMKENVEDWKELTESIKIDFNYDGSVFEPKIVDVPEKENLVIGEYEIPEDAGTIRIKITDLLSESLELTLESK
jgi:site-specific DNA-methyltransferase (adenine-specific)